VFVIDNTYTVRQFSKLILRMNSRNPNCLYSGDCRKVIAILGTSNTDEKIVFVAVMYPVQGQVLQCF